MTAEATYEADQLKLLGRSIAPADIAVADVGARGLKIYIEQASILPAIASVLDQAADQVKSGPKGLIVFALLIQHYLVRLRWMWDAIIPVNPQIKGAIKSLNGVLEVEEV